LHRQGSNLQPYVPKLLDHFATNFSVARRKAGTDDRQSHRGFAKDNLDVEKARAEFGRAQGVEKRFHRDFDGSRFHHAIRQAEDKTMLFSVLSD
jgi:hypothetical protein